MHGAVGTGKGASPRREQGYVPLRAAQVVRGQDVFGDRPRQRGASRNLAHPRQRRPLAWAGEHGIGPRVRARVRGTERGIDAAQGHRHTGPARLDAADDLVGAGIPVGHHRGHEHGIGAGLGGEIGLKDVDGQAIPSPAAGDVGQGGGLGHLDLCVLPTAVRVARRARRWCGGVVPVQAVDQGHLVPGIAQHGGHGQQAERFDPQVIGRKVIDPGIDTQHTGHWLPNQDLAGFLQPARSSRTSVTK